MNTFHIETIPPAGALDAVNAFVADLDTFYNAIEAYFSAELNGLTPYYRAYNLIEPKPRVSIQEDFLSGSLAASSTRAIRELACVVTWKAPYVSGVRPSRKRGRTYLGPLGSNVVGTSDGLFTSAFVTAVSTAADALATAASSDPNYKFVVYSPTTDTAGTGETGGSEIEAGWVDTTPDIQRRRGLPPGAKTLFTA